MGVRYLSVEDVRNLGKTCRILKKKVNNLFVVESVILPLSPGNRKKLQGRYILDLTSSASLGLWKEAGHLDVVSEMNLSRMKNLKFNGPNFVQRTVEEPNSRFGYYNDCLLHPSYLDCLSHFMSHGTQLTSLDMLIDSTQPLQDLVQQASKLTLLEEVTFRESGRLISSSDNDFQSLNKLLNSLFSRSRVRKFTLKSIALRRQGEMDCNQLEIVAPSLETLHIHSTKTRSMEIGLIGCGNLKEMILEEDYWSFCLYHNQCADEDGRLPNLTPDTPDRMGRLAPALYSGCPRLDKFNNLDLRLLRKRNAEGDWLKELAYYKGEGLDGTSCVQCGKWEEYEENMENAWAAGELEDWTGD